MPLDLLKDPIVQFFILVAVGLLVRVTFGRNPVFRLIANIAFFALLTILLLYHRMAPYASDMTSGEDLTRRILFGFVKAVWWIGGAMVLASCAGRAQTT